MIRLSHAFVAFFFVASASACASSSGESDNPLDIGETAVLGEKLTDYAASWSGYAEAHTFGEYGDTVQLNLAADGSGTLRVGDAALAGTATDPDAPYPPAVTGYGEIEGAGIGNGIGLTSGFPYPIANATVSSSRLQFQVDLGDALDGWCQLQTSYEFADGVYGCLPNTGFGSSNGCFTSTAEGVDTPIDCFKLAMCLVITSCDCDAAGCYTGKGGTVAVDVALENDGDSLVGTLNNGERITIRMTRDD